jgi:hypothetical protein
MTSVIEGFKGISRRNIYIALSDIEFYWSQDEVLNVVKCWNSGYSIGDIAKEVERPDDEVALLVISVNAERKVFNRRSRDAIHTSSAVEVNRYVFNETMEKFTKYIKNGYYVFDNHLNIDFIWCETKVLEFEKLWNEGFHIVEIQKKLKRKTIYDIAVLVIDRCRKGYIQPRKEGLEGITDGCPIRVSTNAKQKDKTA